MKKRGLLLLILALSLLITPVSAKDRIEVINPFSLLFSFFTEKFNFFPQYEKASIYFNLFTGKASIGDSCREEECEAGTYCATDVYQVCCPDGKVCCIMSGECPSDLYCGGDKNAAYYGKIGICESRLREGQGICRRDRDCVEGLFCNTYEGYVCAAEKAKVRMGHTCFNDDECETGNCGPHGDGTVGICCKSGERCCNANNPCPDGKCERDGYYCVAEEQCESHSRKRCLSGNVYWVDSCGNIEDVYEECGEFEECKNEQCVTQVISHDYKACYEGDVYWYDNLARKNDLFQDCKSNEECVNDRCVAKCESHHEKKCFAGNVYWLDSCGNDEEIFDDCSSGETCVNAKCVTKCESFYEKKCVAGNVYWFDSCGNEGDMHQDCEPDEKCENARCVEVRVQGCNNDGDCEESYGENCKNCANDCQCATFQCCASDTSYAEPTPKGCIGSDERISPYKICCDGVEESAGGGETCESVTEARKKSHGESCIENSECKSHHCEDNICCEGSASPGENCCRDQNDCTNDRFCNDYHRCERKKEEGVYCNLNVECISGECWNSECYVEPELMTYGETCESSHNCEEGLICKRGRETRRTFCCPEGNDYCCSNDLDCTESYAVDDYYCYKGTDPDSSKWFSCQPVSRPAAAPAPTPAPTPTPTPTPTPAYTPPEYCTHPQTNERYDINDLACGIVGGMESSMLCGEDGYWSSSSCSRGCRTDRGTCCTRLQTLFVKPGCHW